MRLTRPSLRVQAEDFLRAIVRMVLSNRRAKTLSGERRISSWQLFERLEGRDTQFGMGEDGEGQHRYHTVLGSPWLETSRRTIPQACHQNKPQMKSHLHPHPILGSLVSPETLPELHGRAGRTHQPFWKSSFSLCELLELERIEALLAKCLLLLQEATVPPASEKAFPCGD